MAALLECTSYIVMVFGAVTAMISWIGLLVSGAFLIASVSGGEFEAGALGMFGGTLCAGMSIFMCSYCWIADRD